MNSRLLGEYVEEVETATEAVSCRDSDTFSTSRKGLSGPGIEEHAIIDPIVQELDRILQCTNKHDEESTVNSSLLKNPRHRCIYTTVDNSAADSTLNSPKRLQRNLAATYVVSSGGDGFSHGMTNDTSFNVENIENSSVPMTKTIFTENIDTLDTDRSTDSMIKSETVEITKIIDSNTISEESHDSEFLVDRSSQEIHDFSSFAKKSKLVSTPFDNYTDLEKKLIHLPNGNVGNYCATPTSNLRNLPKRKISVFHRSFDIDTFHDEKVAGGCSDTYRVTERPISTSMDQENVSDDAMELDPECMKMTINTRKFLLNYRDKNDNSDSSDSLSPLKTFDNYENSSIPEEVFLSQQSTAKPLILAPTKLKLASLMEIPPYASKNDESSSNEKIGVHPDETDNYSKESRFQESREILENTDFQSSEILTSNNTDEILRTKNEIERGVTYQKISLPRELDSTNYSILSSMNETSLKSHLSTEKLEIDENNVVLSDNESTSCDSSPKRELPVSKADVKLPLLSTYEKPMIGDRNYARQDPSTYRGSWYDRSEETSCCLYQMRNESTTSVGNYSGVTGTVIRDGQDEKTNVSPAVALAMSSGEETSDSECDPMAIRDNDRCNVVNETRSISPTVLNFVDGALLGTSTPAPTNNNNNNNNMNNNNNNNVKKLDEIPNCDIKKSMAQKRDKKERPYTIRRSLSDSGCGRSDYRCRLNNVISSQEEFNKEETHPAIFPSLTDARLQESGIAKLFSGDAPEGNLSEADLERKYMALSIGLVTDRVTLPRRVALSIRQRDQSEKNLVCEVYKMHQDIQDLAPLCIDRESVERVERVRHQLDMITQCAHRVSCTAETLGAVHQENRISRAILLADRYLLVLRSRCEKLALDLSETKRILMENNIFIEEHNGELGDDTSRTRYRGVPITNRTMMARRRASIATIFRPLGNFQDVTKDGLRQRNSVSGRVTLRRPSLSAESQKWEAEKLDRTDSSSSIGELREIFEQAESRRNSREENNNNVLRLHSSNLSIRDCENNELDVWTNAREEAATELSVIVDGCHESRHGRRTPLPHWITTSHASWKTILWCIIISFFFGFYVKHAVSSVNECSGTHFKWWSIEEIFERYLPVENDKQRPI